MQIEYYTNDEMKITGRIVQLEFTDGERPDDPVFVPLFERICKNPITGYSPERFLNMCCFHGIRIWNRKASGMLTEMYISLVGPEKLVHLQCKTHMRIYVDTAERISFLSRKLPPQRCIIFAGILLSILADLGIFTFIWDIHFEGK